MKKLLKKTITALFAGCIIVAAQASLAATIDKIISFGDSTSDNGNIYAITEKMHKVTSKIPLIPRKPPYYEGRFSNGPIWLETVSAVLDVPLSDYAYGGSWAEPLKDSHQFIPFSLGMQVNFYLVKGIFDRHKGDHLYTIWSGANDYLEGRKDIEYATSKTVNTIKQQLSSLIYYGGKQFLIMGVPDLSKSPKFRLESPDVQEDVKLLSQRHNEKLEAMIQEEKEKHPDVKILYINTAKELEAVEQNPEQYGLKNVTEACYKGDYYLENKYIEQDAMNAAKLQNMDILNNTSLRTAYINARLAEDGVEPCKNPEDYLFWDKVHPSAASHQLMAMLALNELDEQMIYGKKKLK